MDSYVEGKKSGIDSDSVTHYATHFIEISRS